MLKSLIVASALSFALLVPTVAEESKVMCDEAGLTKIRADIDSMTDKEKQKSRMASWEAANTAFKANDMKTCNERVGETNKGMDGTGNKSNDGNTSNNPPS